MKTNESKHTPGPWNYDSLTRTIGDASETMTIASIFKAGGAVEEQEANARLIAAAPDLLAALRNTTDALHFCLNEAREHLTPFDQKIEVNLKANRAAIAKAEGTGTKPA